MNHKIIFHVSPIMILTHDYEPLLLTLNMSLKVALHDFESKKDYMRMNLKSPNYEHKPNEDNILNTK